MDIDDIPVVDEKDDAYQMENAENMVDMHKTPEVEHAATDEVEISDVEESQDATPTVTKTIETLERGQETPAGLSKEQLQENMVEKDPSKKNAIEPYKKNVKELEDKLEKEEKEGGDTTETKKALEKAREDLKKQYKALVDSCKEEIAKNRSIIIANYNTIKEGIASIKDAVSSFMQSMAQPSVISSPPSAPNPAHTVLSGKALKCQLSTALGNLTVAAVGLCYAAKAIKYELPEAITSAINGIALCKTILDQIPG